MIYNIFILDAPNTCHAVLYPLHVTRRKQYTNSCFETMLSSVDFKRGAIR